MSNSKNLVQNINSRTLSSNTQRVAYRLLRSSGEWVSRKELERLVGVNATSRVRDLRTESFGSFTVECASAVELNKRADKSAFFYRIQPQRVTQKQLGLVFGA